MNLPNYFMLYMKRKGAIIKVALTNMTQFKLHRVKFQNPSFTSVI